MKWRAEVYYRFKKARNGVCLGMEIDADSEVEAFNKAEAICIGPRWPSRIWVATDVHPKSPNPGDAEAQEGGNG